MCSAFEKAGNSGPGSRGSFLSGLSICLQIQKPVVNTNMEKLAHELEGLAQTQVRRKQGRQESGRDLRGRRGWEWLDRVRGDKGSGRELRAPTREARGSPRG